MEVAVREPFLRESFLQCIAKAAGPAKPDTRSLEVGYLLAYPVDGEQAIFRLDHVQLHTGRPGGRGEPFQHLGIGLLRAIKQVDRTLRGAACRQLLQARNEWREANAAGDPYLAGAVVCVIKLP